MGKGFASLGDKLADRKVGCRVRGCPRTWLWRAADQLKSFSAGQTQPPARMCDLCHARAQTLEERQIKCQSAGCENGFGWSRIAQLEAIIKHSGEGEPQPPRGLCESCRGKARELGDKQVPCRMKACGNTWTWSGRAQLAAGAASDGETVAPTRMCDSCHHAYEQLADDHPPCKVRGCTRTWTFTRWQQLEARLAHRDGAPPERMCDECVRLLKTLEDRRIPCRTEGCDGHWVYTRAQQLESHNQHQEAPPARMCSACQSKFSHLKDISVPCKRTGCKGSWLYKRGAQLERWIKQRESPEHAPSQRLCDVCRRHLDDFQDREVACKNEGCKSTWTWTRFAQLQAAETGHHDVPPAHMCAECREFLENHRTKSILCTHCNAELHWAPELQLKTKLGLMREPSLCGSCKRLESEAARKKHHPTL